MADPLETYFSSWSKVKVLRSGERVGLIRGRLLGAREATGEVLTFLDSHCEVTEGWLQPLLQRISEDPTNVVCPVINAINAETFKFQFRDPEKGVTTAGGFNW